MKKETKEKSDSTSSGENAAGKMGMYTGKMEPTNAPSTLRMRFEV
jgi:hypothetical protein